MPEVLEPRVPVCKSYPSHGSVLTSAVPLCWLTILASPFPRDNWQLDCPTAKLPCAVSGASNNYLLLLDVFVFPSRVPGPEWWTSKILISFPPFLPTSFHLSALTKPNVSAWNRCVTHVLLNIWLILCGGQRSVQILEWATVQEKIWITSSVSKLFLVSVEIQAYSSHSPSAHWNGVLICLSLKTEHA